MRTSTIILLYSTAEYCAFVCISSTHKKDKLPVEPQYAHNFCNTEVHSYSMATDAILVHQCYDKRKLSLTNRRNAHCSHPYRFTFMVLNSKIHLGLNRENWRRTATELIRSNFTLKHAWKKVWPSSNLGQSHSVIRNVSGYNFFRKQWSTLNIIRTGHGRCGKLVHKWNMLPTLNCDCGYANQIISHIVSGCPNIKYNERLGDFVNLTLSAVEWIKKILTLNNKYL